MSTSRLRSPGFVVLAIICAAVIGLLPTTSAFMSGLKAIIAEAKLLANDIIPLEDAKVPLPRSLRIRIPVETGNESMVDELHALCAQRKGEAKVLFDVERQGDFMVVMEAEGYNVHPDRNFVARVEELCGRGAIRVID